MRDGVEGVSGVPILVTGLHRGGTTWVGRMIAAHPILEYIHEPFNPDVSSGGDYGLEVPHWWIHIHEENEELYLAAVRRMVELKPRFWSQLREASGWRRRLDVWNEQVRLRRRREQGARALIKDPIAFFSSEWLAARFTARVVVVVRHPAAWVDSFLRTGWRQPRSGILDQPRLCEGLLKPFRDVLLAESENGDRLRQTCTTWNMFMYAMRMYQRRHADWIFVRHEDLSADPLGEYERLYGELGLSFDSHCREVVRRHSLVHDDTARYTTESIVRDSRRNLLRWRENLSPASIDRIRELTADYWPDFYSGEEW